MVIIHEETLRACGVEQGSVVLAGISGGADSTALLLSLHEARARGEIAGLCAAHLHHGIRGASADGDMAFCAELCVRLGIPLQTGRADVPAYARGKRMTLEEAARELRYAFLRRAMAESGADCIAVAHQREDQAETLLMHLIRGSGLDGLTGMRMRSGEIVRPMLGVSRAEIEAYLGERGQDWREDETNAAMDAARNRVRHELIPMIARVNPRATETICRTASLLAEDAAYLADQAEDAERRIARGDGLDRAGLCALPPPLSKRILRRRIYAACGNVTNADIRRVLALSGAQTGTRIELFGGRAAWVDREILRIGAYPEHAPYCTPFLLEGETVYPGGSVLAGMVDSFHKPAGGGEAYLDAEKLPEGLVVRTRRDGDRFFPLGAPGSRLLSDWMMDKKIPLAERDAVPLLCAGGEAYYVAGYTVSERVKITENTTQILHIFCKGVQSDGGA